MTTPIQYSPYLPQQRNFPNDSLQSLTVEIDNSYIEIALKVNEKENALYPIGNPIVTAQLWYLMGQSQKQQSLRQVYTFSSTGSIAHGINFSSVAFISPKCFGSFTDGINWYGASFGSNVAVAGEVNFYVTSSNIVIQAGAGVPAITKGYIVLEWISNF